MAIDWKNKGKKERARERRKALFKVKEEQMEGHETYL